MVEGVLAAADIEGVAVGQKDLAAELLHIVRDDLGVLRPQIREVAELAEVDLDRGVAVGEVDFFKTRLFHQAAQLLWKRLVGDVKIGKVYGGFCHVVSSFVWLVMTRRRVLSPASSVHCFHYDKKARALQEFLLNRGTVLHNDISRRCG